MINVILKINDIFIFGAFYILLDTAIHKYEGINTHIKTKKVVNMQCLSNPQTASSQAGTL